MKKSISIFLTLTILFCGCNSGSSDYPNDNDINNAAYASSDLNYASTSKPSSALPPSDTNNYETLKWGYFLWNWGEQNDSVNSEAVYALNDALHKNGFEFNVEIVPIYYENFSYYDSEHDGIDFERAIADFEEKNGSLDLLSLGNEGGIGKVGGKYFEGMCCHLVEQGLFEPLNIENSEFQNLIPEKLWSTVTFDGKIYGIPGSSIEKNFDGICYYLNSDYIKQEDADKFDGTLDGLVNIVSDLSLPGLGRKLCGIDITYVLYNYNGGNYMANCSSNDFEFQHSLILDYKSMKAVNPFEYEPFTEWIRSVNDGVMKNLIPKDANYAVISRGDRLEYSDSSSRGFVPISFVYAGKMSDEDIESTFCVAPEKIIEFAVPAYIENQFNNMTAIRSSSDKKNKAFQLLEAIAAKTDINSAAHNANIGYIIDLEHTESLKALDKEGRILVSPFGGCRIYYGDVEEFADLKIELQNYYTELCQAEDFNGRLAEIQTELKEKGIDDFVNKVNNILEEKGL